MKGSGADLQTALAAVLRAISDHDGDRFLNEAELYDLLRLEGSKRAPASIERVPSCTVAGVKLWLKSQVLTWAALGGDEPRHTSGGRRKAAA